MLYRKWIVACGAIKRLELKLHAIERGPIIIFPENTSINQQVAADMINVIDANDHRIKAMLV